MNSRCRIFFSVPSHPSLLILIRLRSHRSLLHISGCNKNNGTENPSERNYFSVREFNFHVTYKILVNSFASFSFHCCSSNIAVEWCVFFLLLFSLLKTKRKFLLVHFAISQLLCLWAFLFWQYIICPIFIVSDARKLNLSQFSYILLYFQVVKCNFFFWQNEMK